MADVINDSMLTTIDNPWSPYTDYDAWLSWDREHGYDTPGLLARIADVSLDLPDSEINESIGEAIDEIVTLNPNGMYRRALPPAA